jgi:hypothetical protein
MEQTKELLVGSEPGIGMLVDMWQFGSVWQELS